MLSYGTQREPGKHEILAEEKKGKKGRNVYHRIVSVFGDSVLAWWNGCRGLPKHVPDIRLKTCWLNSDKSNNGPRNKALILGVEKRSRGLTVIGFFLRERNYTEEKKGEEASSHQKDGRCRTSRRGRGTDRREQRKNAKGDKGGRPIALIGEDYRTWGVISLRG